MEKTGATENKGAACKSCERPEQAEKNDLFDYLQIGATFFGIVVIYLMIKSSGWAGADIGSYDSASYGLVFVMGLVAAVSSCMAITGGLLISVSSEWAKNHPEMTGWQKFRPLLHFNIGRLFFYGLLGGLVGWIGSALKLSSGTSATVTLIAGLVMLFLGLHLLQLIPSRASRLIPKMPQAFARRIRDFEKHEHPMAPFLLGGATFFLPCGFTQALQLYALSTGSFKTGALTLFVFALGTLPALLSFSALTSFMRGTFKKYFLRVAGALVILIALLNIKAGVVLSGLDVKAWLPSPAGQETNVESIGDKQIARMTVNGLEYVPANFTVKKGVPVEWRIDGQQAGGCGRYIVMPQANIQQPLLADGPTIITFTPEKTGRMYFSCPMGMTTPWAAFTVVD